MKAEWWEENKSINASYARPQHGGSINGIIMQTRRAGEKEFRYKISAGIQQTTIISVHSSVTFSLSRRCLLPPVTNSHITDGTPVKTWSGGPLLPDEVHSGLTFDDSTNSNSRERHSETQTNGDRPRSELVESTDLETSRNTRAVEITRTAAASPGFAVARTGAFVHQEMEFSQQDCSMLTVRFPLPEIEKNFEPITRSSAMFSSSTSSPPTLPLRSTRTAILRIDIFRSEITKDTGSYLLRRHRARNRAQLCDQL